MVVACLISDFFFLFDIDFDIALGKLVGKRCWKLMEFVVGRHFFLTIYSTVFNIFVMDFQ